MIITNEIKDEIMKLIGYNFENEQKHFEDYATVDEKEHHIFNTIKKIKKVMEEKDEFFKLECPKCHSLNTSIDFENDLFHCDCGHSESCSDYGKEFNGAE